MKKSLSYRTGLYRLWLLASVGWFAFGTWYWSSEIDYGFRYYFRHSQLAVEQRDIDRQITQSYEAQREELLQWHSAAMARFQKETESEYGQALRKAGLPLTPPEPNPRIAELSKHIMTRASTSEQPSRPNLFWVAGLLSPPLLLLIAAFAMVRVGHWVWRGFAGK